MSKVNITIFILVFLLLMPQKSWAEVGDVAPILSSITKKSTIKKIKKKVPAIYASLPWKGSIMFSKDDLNLLYDTMENYDKAKPEVVESGEIEETIITEDGQKVEKKVVRKEKVKEIEEVDLENAVAPHIFLSSILYYSPESWTLWINNNRIRRGQEIDNIKIKEVDNERIVFLWRNPSLEVLSPNWSERMEKTSATGLTQWDYKSKDKKILLDSNTGNIEVELGINQTFSGSQLSVFEGFVAEEKVTQKLQTEGIIAEAAMDAEEEPTPSKAAVFDNLVDEIFESLDSIPGVN